MPQLKMLSSHILTREEKDAIQDALEMRVKECRAHASGLRNGQCGAVNPAIDRLALTFDHIAERAETTLARWEELDALGVL